jgi:hypothetical protein
MSNNLQLTDSDFYDKYHPEFNQILLKTSIYKPEDMCAFGGCMYETFDEEFDYVKNQPKENVWTIIDEEDELYIVSGLHIINRVGYLITKEPASSKNETYKFEEL